MVVVVEAFSAGQPRQDPNVGSTVGQEVLSPPPVTQRIDRRRQNEDVQREVRDRDGDSPDRTEEEYGDGDADARAQRSPVEDQSVPHVVLDVPRPPSDRLGIARLTHVVEDVTELNLPEAKQ